MRKDLGPMLQEIVDKPDPGFSCGIGEIDRCVTGRFHGGELWTIGARPGGGKTALMLRMAAAFATGEGAQEALYITSEMKVKEMVTRLLPMASGIPHKKFRTGTLSREESAQVMALGSDLSIVPLKIGHRSRPSLDDIRGMIFQAKPRVVFIDYLQRCRLGRADNLPHAIGEFFADLKSFALDTGCLIFIGCQTDRESDKLPGVSPTMSHLKGSGGIESESDGVMLLWNPPQSIIMKNPDWIPPAPGNVGIELLFRKNRNGARDMTANLELDGNLIKMCERVGPPEQQEAFS
jgi:replicative DNA helicase